MLIAGIAALGWTDPISFIVGIGVGLGLASRFRIIRRPDDKPDHDGEG